VSQSTAQKSVLWWAAKHRHHHLHSDTDRDAHSPRHKGFAYSHLGWIFSRRHETTDLSKIADFARYRELMWLHHYELAPAFVLAIICFLIAGWSGLFVGFFWSTVLVYHATFSINSLAHVLGSKRYLTGDDSRNNWLLAFFTMGEGWHNNHHAYQSSVRQGFRRCELDGTYYILQALAWLGVVWGFKLPPAEVLRNERRLGARVIARAAEQLAAHFNPTRLALEITSASLEMITPREGPLTAHQLEVLKGPHLPAIPSREQILAEAKKMFATSVSLEEIADRAYALILKSISVHLRPVAPLVAAGREPG
jgi:stearoyl-CoA desaturase (delta-9 desaturase)